MTITFGFAAALAANTMKIITWAKHTIRRNLFMAFSGLAIYWFSKKK
jgi:hypothetical protein